MGISLLNIVSAFFVDLGGTLLGTAIGFIAAILWERSEKKKDQRQTMLRVALSINEEIDSIKGALDIPSLSTDENEDSSVEITLDIIILPSAAFESAKHSGDLSLF